MTASAGEPLAAARRRVCQREEWDEQTRLAEWLATHLDPETTFWTSLENKPRSQLSGMFQKLRGVKRGLPDVLVIFRRPAKRVLIVFVELKSRVGVATKAQKQVHTEMQRAGVVWYMARSARAALMALKLAGVVFRCPWTPPQLEAWEGPFADPNKRLPQHPDVAAERREQRQRLRRRQRALKAAQLAAERSDGVGKGIVVRMRAGRA